MFHMDCGLDACPYLSCAELTPVPILQSRLVLCLLCVGETRIRKSDLPKVTWLMRGSGRLYPDLPALMRLVFYSSVRRSCQSRGN